MAKGEPIYKKPTTPDGIILTLNADEAQLVKDVLGQVCGSPKTSRRRHIDAVIDAFKEAGFDGYTSGDLRGDLSLEDSKDSR